MLYDRWIDPPFEAIVKDGLIEDLDNGFRSVASKGEIWIVDALPLMSD